MSSDVTGPGALLITGTVGAGKSSVAAAAGAVLAVAHVPHAVVDLDALRSSWPAPPDDRFNFALELRNLRCVARNYLDAGARRIVLAGAVESRADRDRYRAALGIDLQVCRLRVELPELHRRLLLRHAHDPGGMRWHLQRAGELDRVIEAAGVADFTLVAGQRRVSELAAAVLTEAGWA